MASQPESEPEGPLSPTPLPANPYDENDEPRWYAAYHQCLQAQDAGTSEHDILLARWLGYLVLYAPIDEGRDWVSDEIIQCFDPDSPPRAFESLAELYLTHLPRYFRQSKSRTPATSDHPSNPTFQDQQSLFSYAVEPHPTDHKSAKRAALRRDGYRCMLSGLCDKTTYKAASDEQRAEYNLRRPCVKTNFSHIFPPRTEKGTKDAELRYSGAVWALVENFAQINVLLELDGHHIHSLENGLTLSLELHDAFDDLDLWFDAVPGRENTYRVHAQDDLPALANLPANRIITWTTSDPSLPLPAPRYLKLHAAICRIAHLSGAAEYLEKFDRDAESMTVLAIDGSSAPVLADRLQYLVLVQ